MPIVPDTKDWTWVLERPCPECGFDSSSVATGDVAPLIGANAGDWVALLARSPTELRARVGEDRWSPLEYACHVRDVFLIFDRRLDLMEAEDHPTFANWDQDETAVEERYNEQAPGVVASELALAAAALAASFAAVEGGVWDRRGSRSDGATFTVATLARYLLHDPIHHLHDVRVDLGPVQND